MRARKQIPSAICYFQQHFVEHERLPWPPYVVWDVQFTSPLFSIIRQKSPTSYYQVICKLLSNEY